MTSTLKIPLNKAVEQAIITAQSKAREFHQAQFSGGHLLWGLLREEVGLHPFVEDLDQNVHRLSAWAELRIENAPKSARSVATPTADEQVQNILQEAYRLRTQRFEAEVSPLTVLEAICTPEIGFTASQLKRFPLDLAQVQAGRKNITRLAEALTDAVGMEDNYKKTNNKIKNTNKKTGNNLSLIHI